MIIKCPDCKSAALRNKQCDFKLHGEIRPAYYCDNCGTIFFPVEGDENVPENNLKA